MADNIWTLLEQDAPAGCDAVQELYSWSLNYESGRGPFVLFLDVIGWSEDNVGESLYKYADAAVGYVEADKLGRALVEYSNRPQDVLAYVDALMTAESGEQE